MKHILVDLDGTLAYYDPDKDYDPTHIGAPILPVQDFIKKLLETGITVKIFTARAEDLESIPMIQDWTEKHLGRRLNVVNFKTKDTVAIIDDRAYHVTRNEGYFPLTEEDVREELAADLVDNFESEFKLIGMKHE